MNKTILIQNKNIPNSIKQFIAQDDIIDFDYSSSKYKSIDEYISKNIIENLTGRSFDIVYIKDNLSSYYLELFGLRVAYHIRLSQELGGKKQYIPIVILSDMDGYTLNKLKPMSKILFTKNIFLEPNNKNTFEKFNKRTIERLSYNEFINNFLKLIEIEPPENSSNHDIANKWAIDRWADFLGVKTDAIEENHKDISSMLYFKYLKAKYPIKRKKGLQIIPKVPKTKGKILYLDDEWAKGWSDIFEHYFKESENIDFQYIKEIDKDSSFKDIKDFLVGYIDDFDPDMLLLDMRLAKEDQQESCHENISGIKLLKFIKEDYPYMQVILLTASGKSMLLDIANTHNLLGYIKKEHPEDRDRTMTKETFNKLKMLIDNGLSKSYLKEIYRLQKEILKLSLFRKDDDIFRSIKLDIESVFEILNSGIPNKFNFVMLAIYKVLERIRDCYIDDRDKTFKDSGESIKVIYKIAGNYEAIEKDDFIAGYKKYGLNNKDHASSYQNSTKNRFLAIFYEKLSLVSDTLYQDIESISKKRNNYIHPKKDVKAPNKSDIIEWLKMLKIILEHV